MLIEQAREDALNMHESSKTQGVKNHARRMSANFHRDSGFQGDLH